MAKKRQFGFAFLLFVPYLAYWGYNAWLRAYKTFYNRRAGENICYYGSLPSNRHSVLDQLNSTSPKPLPEFDYPVCERQEMHFVTSKTKSKMEPHTIKELPHQKDTDGSGTHVVSGFTTTEYQTAIANITSGSVTTHDCQVVNHMLRSSDTDMLADGLKLVSSLSVRSSAETKEMLFDCGLGGELIRLVRSRKKLPLDTVLKLVTCVSNLSLSERGQTVFKDIVVDIADVASLSSQLIRPSLNCLTNLSVTEVAHFNFTKLINFLYQLLDNLPNERVYILRILVNLSTNAAISPYLLAARMNQELRLVGIQYSSVRVVNAERQPEPTDKQQPVTLHFFLLHLCHFLQAPKSSLVLLDSSDEDVAVRWLRILVSISGVALNKNLSVTDLPVLYKAPSPETLYSFLFSVESTNQLTATLLHGGSYSNEAKNLANQLYKSISLKSIAQSS